jgi:hypothetical protein
MADTPEILWEQFRKETNSDAPRWVELTEFERIVMTNIAKAEALRRRDRQPK